MPGGRRAAAARHPARGRRRTPGRGPRADGAHPAVRRLVARGARPGSRGVLPTDPGQRRRRRAAPAVAALRDQPGRAARGRGPTRRRPGADRDAAPALVGPRMRAAVVLRHWLGYDVAECARCAARHRVGEGPDRSAASGGEECGPSIATTPPRLRAASVISDARRGRPMAPRMLPSRPVNGAEPWWVEQGVPRVVVDLDSDVPADRVLAAATDFSSAGRSCGRTSPATSGASTIMVRAGPRRQRAARPSGRGSATSGPATASSGPRRSPTCGVPVAPGR